MKSIIVFRHAKSDWNAHFEHDYQRPLAQRGRKAAALMGQFLKSVGQIPDTVKTSSAVRAVETVRLASQAGGWQCPVRVLPELYDCSPAEVLREVNSEDAELGRLLIAGHEPTLSLFIGLMIGQTHIRFPTAAMARIDLDIDTWQEAEFGRGWLVWLIPPKLLGKRIELR